MAKKRNIKRHEGGIPTDQEFQYAVQEGQSEAAYRKTLKCTYEMFVKAEKEWRDMNISRLGSIWTIGDSWAEFFAARKSANRGQVSDADLLKVAQDLGHFADGRPISKEILRMALNIRQTYTRASIEKLAARGASETHVASYLQIEDRTMRKQVEESTLSENLSGAQTRKVVRDIAKDPVKQKYLKPSSRARYKQEASRKQNKIKDNPVKQVAKASAHLDQSAEVFADLLLSLKGARKLELKDKQALVEPLEDLLGKAGSTIQALNEIRDKLFDTVMACQAVRMDGPAPTATAERAVKSRSTAGSKAKGKKAKTRRKSRA